MPIVSADLNFVKRSNDGPYMGESVVNKTISKGLRNVHHSKRELGFIKNDMATYYDVTRGQIIAFVTTMIR